MSHVSQALLVGCLSKLDAPNTNARKTIIIASTSELTDDLLHARPTPLWPKDKFVSPPGSLNHCPHVSVSQPNNPSPIKAEKIGACGNPGPPNSGSRPMVPGNRIAASPAAQ